jgi:hypothetical protein
MSYPLFREDNKVHSSFEKEAIRSNYQASQLSDLYFSPQNVEALHEAIRYQVYIRSGNKHVIDRQSDTDLKVVMRSIFYEYARNLPYDVVGQVRELNTKVIDYCVPKILMEINMYIYYRQDISQNPQPLPRSENTSSAGTKVLFMKEF